ncbi:hypothetical protein C0992_007356 [Termitomyces sp. T32_za158]|nr:hypothetical protein C0992_007356 [Termitomyces sp. T32_za158]
MHIEALLPRQAPSPSCTTCPDPPPCNCTPDQDCIQINRDCSTCARTSCVDKPSSGSSGGASKGATAGAIVGALVFLGIAITFFLWYRRKSRTRERLAAALEPPKDIPAAAETVLNRPDPTEKGVGTPAEVNVPHVHPNSNTSTSLDINTKRSSSHYHTSRRSNNDPFGDATSSIQTAGTEGTNVIPIALVPVDTQRSLSPSSTGHAHLPSTGSSPIRPARSPDLYLDHVNVSNDSLHPPTKSALSTRSGISGFTNRNSFGSNATFSSDLLNEAPIIVTPSKGAVRQVVGVVKAEVINAPGPLVPNSDSLKAPPNTRPVNKSPLASTSFVPRDINKDGDDHHNDPFSDHASINAALKASTFARVPTTARESQQSDWIPDVPSAPWARSGDSSRPSSISTQSGSVIDIGSATRIHVGLSNTRSTYRTTMGRLISPSTPNSATIQDQDQRTQLPAQSQAQGSDGNRRVSSGSAMSGTSTRADSLLEFFPFVPPSPISDRPVRSPPVSPLTQQSFNTTTSTSSSSTSSKTQHVIKIAPPSPLAQDAFSDKPPANAQVNGAEGDALPPPPSRQTLGLSTGSQLSTSSSGLGSFPFQIETGEGSAPPSSLNLRQRQRASLDTLALTSDLSSYPLGFDRDSVQVPMPSTSTHKR